MTLPLKSAACAALLFSKFSSGYQLTQTSPHPAYSERMPASAKKQLPCDRTPLSQLDPKQTHQHPRYRQDGLAIAHPNSASPLTQLAIETVDTELHQGEACQLVDHLPPVAKLNLKKERAQSTILTETLKTIKDLLPSDDFIVSGRVKSRQSRTNKHLKTHIEHLVGKTNLEAISQSESCEEILRPLVKKHWACLNSKLTANPILHDSIGIRVITRDNHPESCYQALKAIIDSPEISCFYCLRDDSFKDYIKHPKNNNYQSLHAVINSNIRPELQVELQVRTADMHSEAESGGACHEQYKRLHEAIWSLYEEQSALV